MSFEAMAIAALHNAHYAFSEERVSQSVRQTVATFPLYAGYPSRDLPILSKARLAAARPSDILPRSLVIADHPELRRISTSGALGAASVWITPEDGAFTPATNNAIMDISDEVLTSVAMLTSPQCSGAACSLETDGTYVKLPPTFDIFAEPQRYIDDMVGRIADLGPVMLLTNPVLLHALAVRADGRLKLSGAIMSSYQRLNAPQRRGLALLGVPIFEQYGATELAGAMVTNTCKHGTPHVWEAQVHVEIVDDSIILTTLAGGGTRLVRYDVGDLGRLRMVTCACGLPEGRALDVLGRRAHAWRQGDLWISEAELDRRLTSIADIDFVQVTKGTSGMRVTIVARGQLKRDDVEAALGMPAEVIFGDRVTASAGKYPFVRRWDT